MAQVNPLLPLHCRVSQVLIIGSRMLWRLARTGPTRSGPRSPARSAMRHALPIHPCLQSLKRNLRSEWSFACPSPCTACPSLRSTDSHAPTNTKAPRPTRPISQRTHTCPAPVHLGSAKGCEARRRRRTAHRARRRSVTAARIATSASTAPAVSTSTSTRILVRNVRSRFGYIVFVLHDTHSLSVNLAFVCSYPGCNRRFNVNSNMRRHYRNHLTSRRRDAVARLIQHPPGGSSHSPPMSVSPSHSPEPTYPHNASSYHYPRPPYSLEHSTSYSDPEEYEAARSPSSTTSSVRHHPYPRPPSPPSSYYSSDVKRETPEPALPVGVPESNMRDDRELERAQCRLRSNSSPVPRYREDRALRHAEPACDRPGCSCNTRPVSTALRPAFPEYLPQGGERSRAYGP